MGTFGGDISRALGINNSGQVVGMAQIPDGTFHAFVYQNGLMTDLNTLINANLGLTLLGAEAINNKGQIAGIATAANGKEYVYLYDNKTVSAYEMQNVNNVTGLNDSGQIIGNYLVNSPTPYAFMLNNGILSDIHALQGTCTDAFAINSNGSVVGSFIGQNYENHAFVYNDGVLTDISGGSTDGSASAINDRGDIVGWGWPDGGDCIYSNGEITDLKAMIDPQWNGVIQFGHCAINDNGQIVVEGYYSNDPYTLGRAFLLSPVPEPSGLGLICSVVVAWFLIRRSGKARKE